MTEEEIMERARELMDAHGLTDWAAQWDRARRRAGACIQSRKTISLSRPLLLTYSSHAVDEVILHEVAHALVGSRAGHGPEWKRQARLLGIAPQATIRNAATQADSGPRAEPWVGTCPRCGRSRYLFRAPRRVSSCGSCQRTFNPELILDWTYRGTPTTPGGAYLVELRRLRRPVRR